MQKLPFTRYPLNGTHVPCPLCRSERSERISTWDRRFKILPHVKCSDCGLIRHELMPSEQDLSDYYASSYRQDYQNAVRGPSERHQKKRHVEASRRLERLRAHVAPGAALIDFGCGSGELIAAANALGYKARGFEPGSDYALFARETKGLPVENCGWRHYASERDADVITSFHVFEHLVDPVQALSRAQDWLKEDGFFYLEVPNMANALTKGFGCLHMAHTLGFGRYSLELLGAVGGMRVVEIFDEYDIGILFQRGTPRPLDTIMADSVRELAPWSKRTVHRQFWTYTVGKLTGKRAHTNA